MLLKYKIKGEKNMNNRIDYSVTISIPIIGDRSISKLTPPKGMKYEHIEIDNYEYKQKIYNENHELLPEFKGAVFEEEGKSYLTVLAGYYEFDKFDESNCDGKYLEAFDDVKNEIEKDLCRYFAILHLLKNGDVARRYSFYSYFRISYMVNGKNISKLKTDSVPADMSTFFPEMMEITNEDIQKFNKLLSYDDCVYQMLKNVALDDFAFNYCIYDSTTNFKSLITILEVLFIKNSESKNLKKPKNKKEEKKSKKTMLSVRISNFLEDNYKSINKVDKNIRALYEIRNGVVHEGKEVKREQLNMLRDYTRRCIKEYMECLSVILKEHPKMKFYNARAYIVKQICDEIENRENCKN